MFYHNLRTVFLCGACVSTLSACSWLPDWFSEPLPDAPPPRVSANQAPAQIAPAPKIVQTADATWIEPTSMNTTSEVYTASAEQRLDTLEKSVASIRNDLNMMMPALTKLVAVQGDLQQILTRMQAENAALGATAPAAAPAGAIAPAPAPVTQAPVTQPVPARATSQPLYMVEPAAGAPKPDIARVLTPAATAAPQSWDNPDYESPRPGVPSAYVPPPSFSNERVALATPPVVPNTIETSTVENGRNTTIFRPAATVSAPMFEPAASVYGGAPSPQFQVNAFRFGEYDGKTRLVFDSTGDVPFSYSIDKSSDSLTVVLPRTGWQPAAASALDSPYVSAYVAEPDGDGGTRVTFALKKGAGVQWAETMPPTDRSGHRVVIDVAKI